MAHEWRNGGVKPGLLVRIAVEDFGRVGHCWMRDRLKVGDLAMALQLSGDCFWTYVLLDHGFKTGRTMKNGYRLIPESRFGAYVLGTPFEFQPSEREYHLLMAGETINLEAEER